MKVLFFGDVYGKAGRTAILSALPGLKEEFRPDFIVANGENLADGKGLTEKTLQPLLSAGIDAVTGGNHLWDRAEALAYISNNPHIAKPANYPPSTPGRAFVLLQKGELKLGLICLCGQIFMPPCDNPFAALDRVLEASEVNGIPVILDFHAESTSEKRAMAWFADGKICAVLGTHTHIQTADEEILPQGTAYITDLGMTGAHDSVIGVRKSIIVEKLHNGIPCRYESSDKGLQINAVCMEIDPLSGCATAIQRIRRNIVATGE